MSVGKEFYEKVLAELISYIKEEISKGNKTYANYKFDEIEIISDDEMPF